MKKIAFLTAISGLILLTFCSFAYAKGAHLGKKNKPPKIEPLIYKGIKFVAPNTIKEMGYVQAWDIETGDCCEILHFQKIKALFSPTDKLLFLAKFRRWYGKMRA